MIFLANSVVYLDMQFAWDLDAIIINNLMNVPIQSCLISET